MFEKEYFDKYMKDSEDYYDNREPMTERKLYQLWKDGAEFGYNKANEWHDLQKDPKDYPEKEKLGQTFIVAFAFNEQTQKYYSFDCAEYIDKGRFITHTINGSNENNGYKVIAWKEIVLPKEVEG